MGISLSLLLVAAGAILTWAVTTEVSGLDIQVVGAILMIVGIVGLALSFIFWSSWGGFGGPREAAAGGGQNTTVIKDDRV